MANLNDIKLSAQDILKKQFRSKVKGYDPDEVDAYLDQVISDYETFQQLIEDLYGQIGTLQRQLMDEKQKEKKTVAAERKDEEKLKTYT
nr:DivIVA domain-containing protein [Lactobacillus amylovorus]